MNSIIERIFQAATERVRDFGFNHAMESYVVTPEEYAEIEDEQNALIKRFEPFTTVPPNGLRLHHHCAPAEGILIVKGPP